jgi:hypothetical protein
MTWVWSSKSFTEVEYLIYEYTSCDYRTWSSKSNEIEWDGITNHYYSLDHIPPSNFIVLCRICRQSSTCLNLCNSWIYCVRGSKYLSRTCIHLGVHFHPASNGQCRGSLEAIARLIAHKVAKAPPTIFLHGPISLEFDIFLLVPTLPVLKSLSLKKLSSTYNPTWPLPLENFSSRLRYFNMFCGLILH